MRATSRACSTGCGRRRSALPFVSAESVGTAELDLLADELERQAAVVMEAA